MRKTMVITGSASGIGKATAALLVSRGCRVIGVDRSDAEVIADLSTAEGREEMIRGVESLSPNGIDAVVAAAGVSPPTADAKLVTRVNYFGAIATLEGLRPLLSKSQYPRAVAVSSTSVFLPRDDGFSEGLLSEDENVVLGKYDVDGSTAYTSGKYALARWVRSRAVKPEWAGCGILLNAVAPGVIVTPMTVPVRSSKEGQQMLAESQPNAVGRFGEPEEVAEALAFLADLKGNYILGQVLFVDGGIDALLRPAAI